MGCSEGYFGLSGARQQGSKEDYITKSVMIRSPHRYYSSDQIKTSVMGGECGEKRCMRGFGGESRRKETAWKTKAWRRG